MVHAILAGTKTMTRRLITPGTSLFDGRAWPKGAFEQMDWADAFVDPGPSPAGNAGPYLKVARPAACSRHRIYPRIAPGDRLWAKETFARGPSGRKNAGPVNPHNPGQAVYYRADGEDGRVAGQPWRPSIFMERWMSRVTLAVIGVRVERLHAITEDDATAEGVAPFHERFPHISADQRLTSGERAADAPHRAAFAVLWDEINGERATWASNPWVFVVAFERVEQGR
jgi:hypothetical protein